MTAIQRLADARELERIASEYTVKLPVRLDPAMLRRVAAVLREGEVSK